MDSIFCKILGVAFKDKNGQKSISSSQKTFNYKKKLKNF